MIDDIATLDPTTVLGLIRSFSGSAEAALGLAAKAADRFGDYGQIVLAYGQLLSKASPAQAAPVLARAEALQPSPEATVAIARNAMRLGRPFDALHRLNTDAVRAIDDPDLMVEACQIMFEVGDYALCLRSCAHGLAQTADPRLLVIHGRAAKGIADDAAEGLRPELRIKLLRANERLLRRRPKEAVELFEALVLRAPNYAPAWIGLRGAYLASGDARGAASALERWAAISGASAGRAQALSARTFSRRGLLFDLEQNAPLRSMGDALPLVHSPAELLLARNARLIVDRGGRNAVYDPMVLDLEDEQRVRVANRTAETFIAGVSNALLVGRGLVIGEDGGIVRELHLRNLEKYGATADGDLAVWRPEAFAGLAERPRIFDTPAISLVGGTDKSFGDWITNFLPRLTVLRDAGLDLPIVVGADTPGGFVDILCAMGVRRDSILVHHRNVVSFFPKLYVVSQPLRRLTNAMDRLFEAHACLAKAPPPNGPSRRIYLSRERIGKRSLENEAEVREAFERRGFEVVYPELLSLEEMTSLLADTSHLGSPYGSGLLNLAFSKVRPSMVICLPPYKEGFIRQLVVWLGAMDAQFSPVLGQRTQEGGDLKEAAWRVDIRRLERAIDAALQRPPTVRA